MTTRQQHTRDGSIAERRLRPIYDWLDNGNFKKALQEAEKVLKKAPSLQVARALKAIALLRLGKTREAYVLLDALAEEKPSDDATLQAMTISYRESKKLDKVCQLYENAVKSEPQNEELHSHLFMSYVCVKDFKSQQKAAMALYKFAPKNPYYFWAVMSIVLQAKYTDDKKQSGVLLSLAQRMVEMFINDGKMEAEQEARLYIMILELQEKWNDVLKFVQGSLYSKLVLGSLPQALIPYLEKLNQWKRLNILSKELLLNNIDRWDYYQVYFDSTFQLMKDPSSDGDAVIDSVTEDNETKHIEDSNCSNENHDEPIKCDDTAEKCHEFLCQLVECSGEKRVRGPYLARLELWKRLADKGEDTSIIGDPFDLCLQYLRIFGHKPCAVPDLRQYLAMIPQKLREARCKEFLTCFNFDENSQVNTLDEVQSHVSALGVWMICSPPLSAAERSRLAAALRARYLSAFTRGLAPTTVTEFCAADYYALMAAHHYYYLAVEEQASQHAVEALHLLELLLHNSPANFHAKLLAIKFYQMLGNGGAADGVYARLELKHVQLVSLGWVHCAPLLPLGRPQRAAQLLADTCTFHAHHAKDSMEHLTYAYKYGTFEKLVELMAWGARVQACAWAALGGRERALLALLHDQPAPPRPEPLPPLPAHPDLIDNRDLSVIINWEAGGVACRAHVQRATSQLEVRLLELRRLQVEAAQLGPELAQHQPDASARPELLARLAECAAGVQHALRPEESGYDCWKSISSPFPSRIIGYVNSPVPYRDLYPVTINLVMYLVKTDSPSVHAACSTLLQLLQKARVSLERSLKSREEKQDPLWTLRESLEDVYNYYEYLGYATFILRGCQDVVMPAGARKSKKKTSISPDEVRTNESLASVNRELQTNLEFLEKTIESWPQPTLNSSLEEFFSYLNLNGFQSPVESKLRAGHSGMVQDMQALIKKKLKFLKSLL